MLFDGNDDGGENGDGVASVPEDVADAAIHNQPTTDPVGEALVHLDVSRRAKGTIDGYRVGVILGYKAERNDGSWIIGLEAHPTDEVPSDSIINTGQDMTTAFNNRFTADAVFEKLLRRYDLEENRFGLRHSEDADSDGDGSDEE